LRSDTGNEIFYGIKVTETCAYWTIQRFIGLTYGEDKGVIMTKDGGKAVTATIFNYYKDILDSYLLLRLKPQEILI
jgi:hypothetical protein